MKVGLIWWWKGLKTCIEFSPDDKRRNLSS